MFVAHGSNLSKIATFLCDAGYTGDNFSDTVKVRFDAKVEVAKRNELHKFAVIPKRWIVERTLGWLDNYRCLWKNCERKLHTSLQMTLLAFIHLLLKRY